jgi:hypothetical protein
VSPRISIRGIQGTLKKRVSFSCSSRLIVQAGYFILDSDKLLAPAAVKVFPVPNKQGDVGKGKPLVYRLPQKLQAVAVKVLEVGINKLEIADRFTGSLPNRTRLLL